MNYEITIIGAGPTGLQAAIYGARAGKKVLVLDKGWEKRMLVMRCENCFGFSKGIQGKELLKRGLDHAKRFGAEFRQEQTLSIRKKDDEFEIETPKSKYTTSKILIATGKAIEPVLKNETKFVGKGVSYCVDCDGPLFKNKKVGVVGNEDQAATEVLGLLNYTKDIILFTNGKKPKFSERLEKEIKKTKIKIIEDRISEFQGDEKLEQIAFNQTKMKIAGVFIAVGFVSSLDFARALGLETKGIFLAVDKEQKTSVKGIWAAGDCTGPPFQIAKAVGEASIAALDMTGRAAQY